MPCLIIPSTLCSHLITLHYVLLLPYSIPPYIATLALFLKHYNRPILYLSYFTLIYISILPFPCSSLCWTWWRIGRVGVFHPKSHGFYSHSSRHVGTSCLWRFGVKFWHSIRAVSGAPLISRGLEEALWK